MMDFQMEKDEIFAKMTDIRNGFKPQNVNSLGDLNNSLGVLTGTSLWLISNNPEINDMDDFRDKIDSFKRVLAHPLYMGMERNLCVASGIQKHLDGCWQVGEFDGFADAAGVSVGLQNDEYSGVIKDRYDEAAKFFTKLNEDEEVKRDAANCCFAMNFKFDGNYSDVPTLYSAVSVFRDVLQELEIIYDKKAVNDIKKDNEVNVGVRSSSM